jgi:hypothetical protein
VRDLERLAALSCHFLALTMEKRTSAKDGILTKKFSVCFVKILVVNIIVLELDVVFGHSDIILWLRKTGQLLRIHLIRNVSLL